MILDTYSHTKTMHTPTQSEEEEKWLDERRQLQHAALDHFATWFWSAPVAAGVGRAARRSELGQRRGGAEAVCGGGEFEFGVLGYGFRSGPTKIRVCVLTGVEMKVHTEVAVRAAVLVDSAGLEMLVSGRIKKSRWARVQAGKSKDFRVVLQLEILGKIFGCLDEY
ncbi:hypothetical protein OROGR_000685 [Orobanche gracilis]